MEDGADAASTRLTAVTEPAESTFPEPMQLLNTMQLMDMASSDFSIRYSGIFPSTGLVFGDPLPWDLQSADSFSGFLDAEDVKAADSQMYLLDLYARSSLLVNPVEDLQLQFSTEDIFPVAEPFFV